MSILLLDIESFSEVDLKTAGVYVYAEHPSTEVLVFCYAFDDNPVKTWRPGDVMPDEIITHINEGGEVRAHSAQFERIVLNGVAGKRIGFPYINIHQTVCTAAKCAAHGLPRALGNAAAALGTKPKDDAGRATMLMLSKPRRGAVSRYTRENAPEKFAILDAYCADDVYAERGVDKAVPDLSKSELAVYHLDQAINDRGVRVDLKAIDDAQYVVDRYRDELHKLCVKLTNLNPTQRDKIAEWIRANGYPGLADMQAETVKTLVKDPAVPENVKTVLKIYSTYGNKAVSKLESMRTAVSQDGRIRGMFLYHGANTGRWASLKVQLHNMFRGVIKDPDVAIDAMAARDLQWIRDLYPGVDPMKVIASCSRGMLVPAEGKVLQALDYAGIESRVNAWLFGEDWKLQAFREYDAGRGAGLYEIAYARAFRVRASTVTKDQKQIGKVMDLAFSFEGGVGALVTMADTYGLDLDAMADAAFSSLSPEVLESGTWMWNNFAVPKGKTYDLPEKTYIVCDALKQLWRETNPRIAAGWAVLKEAAIAAIENPGGVYRIPTRKVAFCKINDWLYMRLPSKRRVAYYKPEIRGDALTYMGTDTYTRQYGRTSTYGGKLCLAGDTEVLTDSGWKRIDCCSVLDMLWDGGQWVYSGGLLDQGVRPVVYWEGVAMTPDHEVLTNDGWKTATVAQSERHSRAPVRLPDRSPICGEQEWKNVLAASMRLWKQDCRRGSRTNSIPGAKPQVMRLQNKGFDRKRQHVARYDETPGVLGLAQHARSLSATISSGVAQLRSARHSCVSTLAKIREFLGRHEKLLRGRAYAGTTQQLQRVLAGQLSMGDDEGSGEQHTTQHPYSNAVGHSDGGSTGGKDRGQEVHPLRTDQTRLESAGVVETYDLVNAGPRRRFTVRGKQGQVFIVHNCENAVQATARDLLVAGMVRLEEAGYPTVLHVHDEVVSEIDPEFQSVPEANALMCVLPDWAGGLPLAVEGWRSGRYRK